MFAQGTYLSGSGVATGALPSPELLINCGHAWALILIVLALCCALLWIVAEPGDAWGRTLPWRIVNRLLQADRSGRVPTTQGASFFQILAVRRKES
jgi:hypothetical protein